MIVAANKADNQKRELEAAEFYGLGWEETYAISASHGRGAGDLLDAIVWALPPETDAEIARKAREEEADEWAGEVAAGRLEPWVVGEPDTDEADGDDDADADGVDGRGRALGRGDGRRAETTSRRDRLRRPPERRQVDRCSTRSSGEERAIVCEVPGTTRDAIDTRLEWGGQRDRPHRHGRHPAARQGRERARRGALLDAPGARRRSARADVAVLVIDAVEGLTAQDAHVAGYVVEEGRGLVVAVNKWDLVEDKTDRTFDQYVEWIRREVPFLDFAPIVSISAKTGQRVGTVLELAVDVWGERRKRDPDGELNRVLGDADRIASRRRSSRAAGRRSSTRPRPRSRRRRSCSSPTTRARSTSATGATSRTGCATTFGFDGTPIKLVFRDRASAKLPRRRKPSPPGPAQGRGRDTSQVVAAGRRGS